MRKKMKRKAVKFLLYIFAFVPLIIVFNKVIPIKRIDQKRPIGIGIKWRSL